MRAIHRPSSRRFFWAVEPVVASFTGRHAGLLRRNVEGLSLSSTSAEFALRHDLELMKTECRQLLVPSDAHPSADVQHTLRHFRAGTINLNVTTSEVTELLFRQPFTYSRRISKVPGSNCVVKCLPLLESGMCPELVSEWNAHSLVEKKRLATSWGPALLLRNSIAVFQDHAGFNLLCGLPLDGWISLVIQAPDMLLSLHNEGLIHGNIKPANVAFKRVCDFFQFHLLNFSHARPADVPGLCGTIAFFAPETREPDFFCATASDVYSMGLTLALAIAPGACVYMPPNDLPRSPFDSAAHTTFVNQVLRSVEVEIIAALGKSCRTVHEVTEMLKLMLHEAPICRLTATELQLKAREVETAYIDDTIDQSSTVS